MSPKQKRMKTIKGVPSAVSSASNYIRDAVSRLGFKGSVELSVKATRIPTAIQDGPSTPLPVQSATKLSSVTTEFFKNQVEQAYSNPQPSLRGGVTAIKPSVEVNDTLNNYNDQRQYHLDNFASAMTDWMKKDDEKSTTVLRSVVKKEEPTNMNIQSPFGSDNGDGNDDPTLTSTVPKVIVTTDTRLTRSAVHSRARSLVKILNSPTLSVMNQKLRLKELSKHLLTYPDACGSCIKSGAIPVLLRLRERSDDKLLIGQARQILSLLGHVDPPKGQGIRILSIDGGGIRGVVILEVLRKLQQLTGQPIHQMFDLICGVSTGAILTMLFGPLKADIETCENHYRMVSKNLFVSDFWGGTQRLIMTHAYYDAKKWEAILKQVYGQDR